MRTKAELRKLTKEELINKLVSLNATLTASNNRNRKKSYIIRNTNLRLKKIVKSLNYIIDNPYAVDASYMSHNHKKGK